MATSDLIATLGVSILLLAFLLQILKVISPQSLLYSSLNLVGSALAGYSSWLIGFMPFVILENRVGYCLIIGRSNEFKK